jgi:hypothetical protein
MFYRSVLNEFNILVSNSPIHSDPLAAPELQEIRRRIKPSSAGIRAALDTIRSLPGCLSIRTCQRHPYFQAAITRLVESANCRLAEVAVKVLNAWNEDAQCGVLLDLASSLLPRCLSRFLYNEMVGIGSESQIDLYWAAQLEIVDHVIESYRSACAHSDCDRLFYQEIKYVHAQIMWRFDQERKRGCHALQQINRIPLRALVRVRGYNAGALPYQSLLEMAARIDCIEKYVDVRVFFSAFETVALPTPVQELPYLVPLLAEALAQPAELHNLFRMLCYCYIILPLAEGQPHPDPALVRSSKAFQALYNPKLRADFPQGSFPDDLFDRYQDVLQQWVEKACAVQKILGDHRHTMGVSIEEILPQPYQVLLKDHSVGLHDAYWVATQLSSSQRRQLREHSISEELFTLWALHVVSARFVWDVEPQVYPREASLSLDHIQRVVQRLQRLEFASDEIRTLIVFCLEASVFPEMRGCYQGPLEQLLFLSKEKIRCFLHRSGDGSCTSFSRQLFLFLSSGGSEAQLKNIWGLFFPNTLGYLGITPELWADRNFATWWKNQSLPLFLFDASVPSLVKDFSPKDWQELSFLSPLFIDGPLSTCDEFLQLLRLGTLRTFLASLFRSEAYVTSWPQLLPEDRMRTLFAFMRANYPMALSLFQALQSPSPTPKLVSLDGLRLFGPYLKPGQYIHLCRAFPDLKRQKGYFYAAEKACVFGCEAGQIPLCDVPIEPLVRFCGSKPFPLIKQWFLEKVQTADGEKTRVQTLSEEQKRAILSRYTRYGSSLPLPHWIDLLGVTEERAIQLCTLAPEPTLESLGFERGKVAFQEALKRYGDVSDPLALLLSAKDSFASPPQASSLEITRECLVYLLLYADESSLCGERTILTWGNAPESSLWAAHDGAPVIVRVEGGPQPMAQRSFGNQGGFSWAPVSLRRKILLRIAANRSYYISLLRSLRKPIQYDTMVDEIVYEIDRIARHMHHWYPQLNGIHASYPSFSPPRLDLMTAEGWLQEYHCSLVESSASTFQQLLNGSYALLSTMVPRSWYIQNVEYNRENGAHRHAFLFMSLLLLARSAHLEISENEIVVTFSKGVSFRLLHVRREEHLEDNPGFTEEQFSKILSEGASHTLSPLTQNRYVTPLLVRQFIENIKAFNEEDFYALCLSCCSLLQSSDNEYPDPAESLQRLKASTPLGQRLLPQTSTVLIALTNSYFTAVDKFSQPLIPGAKIRFDRKGLDEYSDSQHIPQFLWPMGNFASAICRFFIPIDPQLHDGNCGINSFLIGMYGQERYGQDLNQLIPDIGDFRSSIVRYAREYSGPLAERYSQKEISDLIATFEPVHHGAWADTVVWECAAKMHRREIRVYSLVAGTFTINGEGEVAPSAVFHPEGVSSDPPINLMHFGSVHYCLLEPRKES